jgi:hypothetical protein
MGYVVASSASFEAIADIGISGLVGTLELQIQDNQGAVVDGPSALAIIEFPAGSGTYAATRTAPAPVGQYALSWSEDGSFAANRIVIDDLTVVSASAVDTLPPITPIGPDEGPTPGPCSIWTTNEDVAACCDADVGTDYDLFEEAAIAASQLLWELSGRLHAGTCEKTVRPCGVPNCGIQVLSRGHIVGEWDGYAWDGYQCGCTPVSRVKLSGYPVREIIEVKIDGAVVDPADYRLDEWRYLTRVDGGRWPNCQRLDLDDTEDGTFSVRYTYGQNPPVYGQLAARQLACETYKGCAGDECALPEGVSRVVRQGIVIEKLAFVAWGRQGGSWRTGLYFVDAFLNSVNPAGIKRRPTIWSPASQARYARPVGS